MPGKARAYLWPETMFNTVVAIGAALLIVYLACGCGRNTPPAERGTRAPATSSAAPKQNSPLLPRYHAIVIGVSKYAAPHGEGWEPLVTARKDAEAVADVLENKFQFEVTRLFDGDATRSGIIGALDSMSSLGSNDAVLIYFAGHGYFDETLGEGYWIPADARRAEIASSAKADWIWNSMVTKMVSAAGARHVLIIADACYGGSLFRGGATPVLEEDFQWYARALRSPSRYLITSGDLEPVMDSGERHSVFAQALLNFLEHGGRPVFSASDIGFALREKVSALTGQLVRMGPLAVGTHAGGEFVFVAPDSTVEWPDPAQLAAATPPRGSKSDVNPAAGKSELLRDAVMLKNEGAEQAAGRTADELLAGNAGDLAARAVADYVRGTRKEEERKALQNLVQQIEERNKAKAAAPESDVARPRVIACFGPSPRDASGDSESLAVLARIILTARIQSGGSFRVVEREALEDMLTELNLSASSLSDKNAGIEIGRLLPASLIVLGDLVRRDGGYDLYMRLVDTESTRILGSFTGRADNGDVLPAACEKLAGEIMAAARLAKPLAARVMERNGDAFDAGLGTFHGIDTGMTFSLVERTYASQDPSSTYKEKNVGKARVATLGEMQSSFSAEFSGEAPAGDAGSLWIEESAPSL